MFNKDGDPRYDYENLNDTAWNRVYLGNGIPRTEDDNMQCFVYASEGMYHFINVMPVSVRPRPVVKCTVLLPAAPPNPPTAPGANAQSPEDPPIQQTAEVPLYFPFHMDLGSYVPSTNQITVYQSPFKIQNNLSGRMVDVGSICKLLSSTKRDALLRHLEQSVDQQTRIVEPNNVGSSPEISSAHGSFPVIQGFDAAKNLRMRSSRQWCERVVGNDGKSYYRFVCGTNQTKEIFWMDKET